MVCLQPFLMLVPPAGKRCLRLHLVNNILLIFYSTNIFNKNFLPAAGLILLLHVYAFISK
jgi:hypothetical protein